MLHRVEPSGLEKSFIHLHTHTHSTALTRSVYCSRRLGAAERYIDQMFAKADLNLSGDLSYEEFKKIADEIIKYMGPMAEVNAAS